MKTAFGGSRGRRLSPTPSVVDFVGGSRSSVAHAGMGARRQMRRHARQLASRSRGRGGGYFFLRSSIWLSSPYCPPSHKRWRFRNSAVANRHALHSDYYSTMRKTATPLNKLWTAEAAAAIAVRRLRARHVRRCFLPMYAQRARGNFTDPRKAMWHKGFRHAHRFASRVPEPLRVDPRRPRDDLQAPRSDDSSPPKKISLRAACKPRRPENSDRARRIAPLIRRARTGAQPIERRHSRRDATRSGGARTSRCDAIVGARTFRSTPWTRRPVALRCRACA